jgi:hypothetical protein
MKRVIVYLIVVLLLSSCDWFSETWEDLWSEDNERFIQAYTEILIARSRYKDTSKANKEVNKIFEKFDYTEEEFRDQYFLLAKNRDHFLIIIDSARSRAKDELVKLQATDLKKQEKEAMKNDSIIIKKAVEAKKDSIKKQ